MGSENSLEIFLRAIGLDSEHTANPGCYFTEEFELFVIRSDEKGLDNQIKKLLEDAPFLPKTIIFFEQ